MFKNFKTRYTLIVFITTVSQSYAKQNCESLFVWPGLKFRSDSATFWQRKAACSDKILPCDRRVTSTFFEFFVSELIRTSDLKRSSFIKPNSHLHRNPYRRLGGPLFGVYVMSTFQRRGFRFRTFSVYLHTIAFSRVRKRVIIFVDLDFFFFFFLRSFGIKILKKLCRYS